MQYTEGVAEILTQQCLKNTSRVFGFAGKACVMLGCGAQWTDGLVLKTENHLADFP